MAKKRKKYQEYDNSKLRGEGRVRYTDLTSRLLESRFFLDLGVEHHGCSMGRKERTVSAWQGTLEF